MRKSSLSVSWHQGAKQYVRYVGYAIGRDGTVKPKCFYLGIDESTALITAARIRGDWIALKASGASVWSKGYLDGLQRTSVAGTAMVGLLANGLTATNATTAIETVNGLTVEQVRTAYLDEQRARLEAGQVSAAFYRGIVQRLTVALDRLPQEIGILNRPIRNVREDDLYRIILYWASLPMGKIGNQCKRVTTGTFKAKRMEYRPRPKRYAKRIGAGYAKDILAATKALFQWAYETERWEMPRRFHKLFRVKFPKVHIEPQCFTLDELSKLYNACQCDRHRLWILLGVNCGFDRTALATVEWSMVKGLDTDHPYLERLRHKTGVYSRHLLWDETVKLLRQSGNRQGLVCRSERGEPLLEQTATTNRDATRQAWRYILDRSGIRHRMSYGKLRKTGAWMVKVIGGLEVSEMYLGHIEWGMNKHYAGRDWGKLDMALTAMREQLSVIWG